MLEHPTSVRVPDVTLHGANQGGQQSVQAILSQELDQFC